jgi:glycosyltransferase involved in cell wall biosynthesis
MVTVCLNQAGSIESALRSVLDDQTGPVEYIVVDGGSTDGTVEIIERYRSRLAYFVSEPDRGQAHALNKGFAQATGDIIGWLNADDLLLPGVLKLVRNLFGRDEFDVLCGACQYEYPDGRVRTHRVTDRELGHLVVYDPIHQPSCFWRRGLQEKVGGLDEGLEFGMDWDLWLKLARAGARFTTIDDVLSVYRVTGINKTSVGGKRRNQEMYRILRREPHGQSRVLTELGYRVLWPLKRSRAYRPNWLFQPISDAARTALLLGLGPMLGFEQVRRCTHPFS